MDEHEPVSGQQRPLLDGPFRRAYAWPILLGPWACSVIGLVVLGFGLLGNSPSEVRVTEVVLGAALVFSGTLMPRLRGPLELGAGGFKGQVDTVPAALALARRAAENAIPTGEPNREERAKDAAEQAIRDLWSSPLLTPHHAFKEAGPLPAELPPEESS
jgi:hypothetical protein